MLESSESDEGVSTVIALTSDEAIVVTDVEREVEKVDEKVGPAKPYRIHIDFKFAPSSSFELVKFDPKCLLYQDKVLPQKVPLESAESQRTDVTLQAILAKARQGGSFGDLLPDMIWEGRVKRDTVQILFYIPRALIKGNIII